MPKTKQSASSLILDAVAEHVATDAFQQRCDATTLYSPPEQTQYLRSRICETLQEGVEIGRRVERQLLAQRFAELFDLQQVGQ